jgi:hypothetical protein
MQWVAAFKDKSLLRQFQDGKETLFQEVLDRHDDLVSFTVAARDFLCVVNMIDGSFTIIKNNVPIRIFADDCVLDTGQRTEKYKYRLIFFNKCLRQFDNNFRSVGGEQLLFTAIGWQTTTSDGENIKRIMQIYSNGFFNFVTK